MTQQLEGFKELEKKLHKLSQLDKGKVIRAGVNAAGTEVVKAARANVPVGSVPHKTYKGRWVSPGFAKRSLAKRVSLDRTKERASVRIGVKSEAFYVLQFLEKGTSSIPKRPWLEPAFKSTREAQLRAFRQKYTEFLKKFTR